ncbi:MAG: large subunit ribosomal protein L13 [Verrucomicrobiales bacterium]
MLWKKGRLPLDCRLTPLLSPFSIGLRSYSEGTPQLTISYMKTFSAKAQDVERKWWVIDAEGKVLGRVAKEAARLIRGKHKPIFTAHVDTGDFVVVINADKAVLTGNKENMKQYVRFSGWVGGQKIENARTLRSRFPERMIEHAVRGMVPHNRLGRQVLKKLKVYAGGEHPHDAQSPEAYQLA